MMTLHKFVTECEKINPYAVVELLVDGVHLAAVVKLPLHGGVLKLAGATAIVGDRVHSDRAKKVLSKLRERSSKDDVIRPGASDQDTLQMLREMEE